MQSIPDSPTAATTAAETITLHGIQEDSTSARTAADVLDDQLFRKLAWQSAGIMALLFFVVAAIAFFFREPIGTLALLTVEYLGPIGIFFGVLAADGLTFPIPPTSYMFVTAAADAPVLPAVTAACIASLFGGSLAYFVGPFLTRVPILGRRIEFFRPRGQDLFDRWGLWTIAVAAITPVPFSIACWFAGIYRMPYRKFLAISLIRAPRMLAYYAIFALGWTSFT